MALLAGVGLDYYTRLERGHLNGASAGVLDALARALQLDEAKLFHHPVVGDPTLTFDALSFQADAGLTLIAHCAEPGSASQDALNLLASWSATLEQTQTPNPSDR